MKYFFGQDKHHGEELFVLLKACKNRLLWTPMRVLELTKEAKEPSDPQAPALTSRRHARAEGRRWRQ